MTDEADLRWTEVDPEDTRPYPAHVPVPDVETMHAHLVEHHGMDDDAKYWPKSIKGLMRWHAEAHRRRPMAFVWQEPGEEGIPKTDAEWDWTYHRHTPIKPHRFICLRGLMRQGFCHVCLRPFDDPLHDVLVEEGEPHEFYPGRGNTAKDPCTICGLGIKEHPAFEPCPDLS